MDFLSSIMQAITAPPGDVIEGKNFYISYRMGETALVGNPDKDGRPKYLILNGDFRDEYRKVIKRGYRACVRVYDKHKAVCRSEWSEDRA